MRRQHPISMQRRGTATVELALVMLFVIVPVIIGVWEMGRFVQAQQIVSSATREGARMAAQGLTIASDGDPVAIQVFEANKPSVKSSVMQYLAGAGLNRLRYEDVDVTFTFLPRDAANDPPLYNAVPGATQPFQGVQNQRFRVTVMISDIDGSGNLKPVGSRPVQERILWTTLGIVRPQQISYQVDWVNMSDRTFQINVAMPSW